MDSASSPPEPSSGVVSLAYVGDERSLIEVAPPHLSEFGLSGTFFVEPVGLAEHMLSFQRLKESGQEMGSACLFGCDDGDGNLPNWTLEMVESELMSARNQLAESFRMQGDFPFAYPGRDCRCLDSSFNPQPTTYRRVVEQIFSVSLTAREGLNDLATCLTSDLAGISAEDADASTLIEIADRALAQGSWAILVFEGVGAGRHGTDAYVHRALCRHLVSRRAQVQPVLRAAYAVRQQREAEWQKMRKLSR